MRTGSLSNSSGTVTRFSFRPWRIGLLVILFCWKSSYAQTQTGSLMTYMEQVIEDLPGRDGGEYSAPQSGELNSWNEMIRDLLNDNLEDARSKAVGLEYQIVEFHDNTLPAAQNYYLVEKSTSGNHHWGTYILAMNPVRNNLILSAPHSKFDANTGLQAVYCFQQTGALAVMINGTHRCNSDALSSCSGTTSVCGSSEPYRESDLAHTITSSFQITTEVLATTIPTSVFVQLHGFSKRSSDPYVIMSNGTRVEPADDYADKMAIALKQEDPVLTFKIAHKDLDWTRLIGFTNTQGREINESDDACNEDADHSLGRFLHIEQERERLRRDEAGWRKMSDALSVVFEKTLSVGEIDPVSYVLYPNPTKDFINVSAEQIISITLYSSTGMAMIEEHYAGLRNVEFDLTNYVAGLYFIRIETEIGEVTEKIVIR